MDPLRPVVELVAQLVDRLLEQVHGEQGLELALVARQEAALRGGLEVAAQERGRRPRRTSGGPRARGGLAPPGAPRPAR